MEMFDVNRRDVYNFDDYMNLKKLGFGGPKSAQLLKDSKGKRIKSNPKLEGYQRTVKRHEAFNHQVFDPTYKALGGDLVHKQEVGKNPYDYPDLYDRMGIATVDMGKYTGRTDDHMKNKANESFSNFLNESACQCGGNCKCKSKLVKESDGDLTGKRVRLIKMEDEYTNLKEGDEGTVMSIDGLGQIHVKWDSGSTLALIPEIDEFEVISDESEEIEDIESENEENWIEDSEQDDEYEGEESEEEIELEDDNFEDEELEDEL